MCSVDDCNDMIPEEQSSKGQCFLMRATHKFRSEFGKSRLVRDKEKVLVAFSGGRASSAMIHLVEQGLSKRAQKKLRFCPSLLFIDDGYSLPAHDRRCRLENIVKKMQSTGMTFYVYSLEQSLDKIDLQPLLTSSEASVAGSVHDLMFDNSNKLLLLLDSVRNQSSRAALLFQLRKRLLLRVACYLQYDKVAVGDTSSVLAARVLSFIAQGRSAQLSHEMSFADMQYDGVMLLRPMSREFSAVEMEAYNRLNGIEPVIAPDEESSDVTIDSLSQKFVSSLQLQQDTTVSTVCRTAEKLETSLHLSTPNSFCSLCLVAHDTETLEYQCEESAEASSLDCMHSRSVDNSSESHLPSTTDAHCPAASGCLKKDMMSQMCYGCRRIAEDMADVSCLPVENHSSVSTSKRLIIN